MLPPSELPYLLLSLCARPALPALHALPALPSFPAIPVLLSSLTALCKSCTCLHLFVLKTFSNQNMKKTNRRDESAVVPKKKTTLMDMKSISIKPSRCIDYEKTISSITVHVELDSDDTLISQLRKGRTNNEKTPVFSGNVGELL